jgi:hypothetical protein
MSTMIMLYLINYRQNAYFKLFETISISVAGQYPYFILFLNEKKEKKKKKTSRYRLSANKMCLLGVFYSKFGCFDS